MQQNDILELQSFNDTTNHQLGIQFIFLFIKLICLCLKVKINTMVEKHLCVMLDMDAL